MGCVGGSKTLPRKSQYTLTWPKAQYHRPQLKIWGRSIQLWNTAMKQKKHDFSPKIFPPPLKWFTQFGEWRLCSLTITYPQCEVLRLELFDIETSLIYRTWDPEWNVRIVMACAKYYSVPKLVHLHRTTKMDKYNMQTAGESIWLRSLSEYYEHSVLPSSSLKAAEGSLECYHIAS